MVILHTETLKKWGGEQNRVLSEAEGLKERGHHVIIACHHGSILAQKAKAAGIKSYEVNMVKQAHLSTIPKLMRIIVREGVDIVVTHSSVDSWAGGIAAKLTGRRLIRFRHNIYPVGRDPLTRFIYGIPDKLVAISSTVKDVMIQHGIHKDRIMVISSSADTERFTPETEGIRAELKIADEMTIIGNTASFTRVKGQRYLFQAFNIISRNFPAALLLAGRVNERTIGGHLDLVDHEFRKNVIFLGHRDDIPRILSTIDIFVFPSLVEGLGTSLIEAMAMARPVAVSDIPTFRDFIVDKENGIFFKIQDPEDIAEKITYLKEHGPLKESMGNNARSTILNKFSRDNMLDKTISFYDNILNER